MGGLAEPGRSNSHRLAPHVFRDLVVRSPCVSRFTVHTRKPRGDDSFLPLAPRCRSKKLLYTPPAPGSPPLPSPPPPLGALINLAIPDHTPRLMIHTITATVPGFTAPAIIAISKNEKARDRGHR